jgi:glycogen debranching enzyme
MEKNFKAANWKDYIPHPVWENHPEYEEFYNRVWELARDHVRDIPGMPQNPYMDEAFCDTQVWIWDSCFMSLFCKFAQEVFPGVETFQNFYDVLYHGKTLPLITPTENEPEWTRAIPGVPTNIKVHIADNPPLFAFGEYENALIHGDRDYLRTLLYEKQSLQRHYEWFESQHEKHTIPGVLEQSCLICEEHGYRWEGGRSGMDNTPRGRTGDSCERERPNNPDMLWIDAICQQALSARLLARLFALLGDRENEAYWNERFLAKKQTVNDFYWDEEDAFYYDIDCNDHHFYKVVTIASYWALTAGVATREQALAMAARLKDPADLGGELPLLSLSKKDGDYSPTGKYWRGSMWLPTAYATLKGLAEYGLYEDAHEAAAKILHYMQRTYAEFEPHTVWECYAPEGYRPGTQTNDKTLCRPDFCGWSALGPISIYIEYVLGFHTVNAFENVVKWAKPRNIKGKIGIKNLRFGQVVTDIVADETTCCVLSNAPYTLEINQKAYEIQPGENRFTI